VPATGQDSDARAWLELATTPGLDAACVVALFARLGSVEACLEASPADFEAAGVPAQTAGRPRQRRPRTVDAGLRWLEEPGHALVAACDAR